MELPLDFERNIGDTSMDSPAQNRSHLNLNRTMIVFELGVILWMEEIRLTSWYGKYPSLFRVLYIPSDCLGFLPSTVSDIQLVVNWWFGAVGGLGPSTRGTLKNPNPTIIFGDPRNPNHRAPNQQITIIYWVVVSNIFYFHPCLGKISNLTNIFQRGWNHQPV